MRKKRGEKISIENVIFAIKPMTMWRYSRRKFELLKLIFANFYSISLPTRCLHSPIWIDSRLGTPHIQGLANWVKLLYCFDLQIQVHFRFLAFRSLAFFWCFQHADLPNHRQWNRAKLMKARNHNHFGWACSKHKLQLCVWKLRNSVISAQKRRRTLSLRHHFSSPQWLVIGIRCVVVQLTLFVFWWWIIWRRVGVWDGESCVRYDNMMKGEEERWQAAQRKAKRKKKSFRSSYLSLSLRNYPRWRENIFVR